MATLVNAKKRFFQDSVLKASFVFADAFNKVLTSNLPGHLKTSLVHEGLDGGLQISVVS